MNLFFIRHAQTSANLSGEIVKNYDSYSILPFDKNEWHKKVGINLPNNYKVLCSPAKRCVETATELFGENFIVTDLLKEFDCSFLGDKKFWEITEEEFNSLSPYTEEDLKNKIRKLISNLNSNYLDNENIVLVTHGLFTRVVYSYINDEKMDSMYNMLNSVNFKFSNLDLLTTNLELVYNVSRWKE